ncbi:MAG TPA: cupin domain-containing protein, partial [Gaiellaceae bacterium]
MGIAHWDEVEPRASVAGHLRGSWRDLGRAAGSVGVGLQRIELEPGKWSTPAHVHGSAEEIFFVLGGSGLSWQDGRMYAIGRYDCLVHRARAEAHTLRAGPGGLDVLAYGHRRRDESAHLPRAGVSWLGASWVEAGSGDHPWAREASAGPPETPETPEPPDTPERDASERPPTIVSLADVEPERLDRDGYRGVAHKLAAAAGSEQSGLHYEVIEPGNLNCPPHCHSAEEELFVILDGEGTCLLGDDEHPVRAGTVVACPAGDGVAHAFRAGPDTPLTMLTYGTREPNDIVYYPRSGKVLLAGVGVI